VALLHNQHTASFAGVGYLHFAVQHPWVYAYYYVAIDVTKAALSEIFLLKGVNEFRPVV
jgi:hypothetical protein